MKKHPQAQAFFDMVQGQLKDPNFQGVVFEDGSVLPPESIRQIDDPDVLFDLVAQIADQNIRGFSNN